MNIFGAYTRPIAYGFMFGLLPEGAADLARLNGRVTSMQSKCIKQIVAIALLGCLYQNSHDVIKVVGITQFSYLFTHVLKAFGMRESEANALGGFLRIIVRYGENLTHFEGLSMIILGMLAGHLGHYLEKKWMSTFERSLPV